MNVSFLEPARDELEEAVAHYNAQRDGLGGEFQREVQDALSRIVNCPTTWSKISANIQRCPTTRFPYDVLYHCSDDEILIVAVMHHHRRPGYWKGRVHPGGSEER